MTSLTATIAVLLMFLVIGMADLLGQSRHLIGWKIELIVCLTAAVVALFAGTMILAGAPN